MVVTPIPVVRLLLAVEMGEVSSGKGMVLSPAPSLGGMESGELFHSAHSGKLAVTSVLDPRTEANSL
jgi:hypothetical protein